MRKTNLEKGYCYSNLDAIYAKGLRESNLDPEDNTAKNLKLSFKI